MSMYTSGVQSDDDDDTEGWQKNLCDGRLRLCAFFIFGFSLTVVFCILAKPPIASPNFRRPKLRSKISLPLSALNGTNIDAAGAYTSRGASRSKSTSPSVLCWIMSSEDNLPLKAIHIHKTWGNRCDQLLFVIEEELPVEKYQNMPVVAVHTPKGYDHLTQKSMAAFDYIYERHLGNADWFLKADDDTYVIMENLKGLLSLYNKSEPLWLGMRFNKHVKQGYHSGGAGYVLSKAAVEKFAKRGRGFCKDYGWMEDVAMGRCLEKLGVKIANSTDSKGLNRFHCLDAESFLTNNLPDWLFEYLWHNTTSEVTDVPVSFHYIHPDLMYLYEYLLYWANVEKDFRRRR